MMGRDMKEGSGSKPAAPFSTTTCTAPVNIAVIKYWGKQPGVGTSLILPTNSSLSVTLDQDQLKTTTSILVVSENVTTNVVPVTMTASLADRVWLNGVEQKVSGRLITVLSAARSLRAEMEAANPNLSPLSKQPLRIVTENNFPTAAGLASSASGFACLAFTLSKLFELPQTLSELSKLARIGSGSACRSMFGGYVAWDMGERKDGSDSMAIQVAPESHWPDMEAMILVVSDAQKDTGSTAGMQMTVETSDLFQRRLHVVPSRLEGMKRAILAKDFQAFADLTMRDSNQFHACCLDTFPPIAYLNDASHKIIRLVTQFNNLFSEFKVAYTFDAGPNAVLYYPKANAPLVRRLVAYLMQNTDLAGDLLSSSCDGSSESTAELNVLNAWLNGPCPISPAVKGDISRIIETRVGGGPRVLDSSNSLIDPATALPWAVKGAVKGEVSFATPTTGACVKA